MAQIVTPHTDTYNLVCTGIEAADNMNPHHTPKLGQSDQLYGWKSPIAWREKVRMNTHFQAS